MDSYKDIWKLVLGQLSNSEAYSANVPPDMTGTTTILVGAIFVFICGLIFYNIAIIFNKKYANFVFKLSKLYNKNIKIDYF